MKRVMSALGSTITFILVVVGIGGLTFYGFRDGGWVATGLSKATDAFFDAPLIGLGLLTAMFLSYRAWRNRQAAGHGSKLLVDLMLYALMAAGAFFIARYVLRGEL